MSRIVEVYIAANEADDAGHDEGKTFLGSVTATSIGSWSLSLPAAKVSVGQEVSATASKVSPAETSEFGSNVIVS